MTGSAARRRGEKRMVPEAEFSSYYGRPVLKETVWGPDIPSYLFLGGLAGASSGLATGRKSSVIRRWPARRRPGRPSGSPCWAPRLSSPPKDCDCACGAASGDENGGAHVARRRRFGLALRD